MLPVIAFRGSRPALGPLLFDCPGEHRQLDYSGRFEITEARLRTSPDAGSLPLAVEVDSISEEMSNQPCPLNPRSSAVRLHHLHMEPSMALVCSQSRYTP